ncbi:hypothetical protein H0V99_02085 [Candidatus Saccharibacteria bacterium]|nr:hypothetical protein [Candidatus Saccharibacteria bacterium]
MLDLIVLGLVPGTSVQLTFRDILLLSSGFVLLIFLVESIITWAARRQVQKLITSLATFHAL